MLDPIADEATAKGIEEMLRIICLSKEQRGIATEPVAAIEQGKSDE